MIEKLSVTSLHVNKIRQTCDPSLNYVVKQTSFVRSAQINELITQNCRIDSLKYAPGTAKFYADTEFTSRSYILTCQR